MEIKGYANPELLLPEQVVNHSGYFLLLMLCLALCAATYFILKKRSRKGVFVVLLCSLGFFGFYQKGCVCAVGALQNVTLAIFDTGYAIPFLLVLFFLLPLLFSLFFGRTFCSSVCPLGAIQELLIIKPLKVPHFLDNLLSFIPYLYLSFAVLFAATGSVFIICQYDPYIAFFRLHGSYNIIFFGVVMLIVGAFIARPYCRFLCPYSVLLRWVSFFSKYHLSISPAECIKCGNCKNACPVGAINKPLSENHKASKQKLERLLLLLPVLIIVFGWSISNLNNILSRHHATVALSERVKAENRGEHEEQTWASATFRNSDQKIDDLHREALQIRKQFYIGGWLIGVFLAIVIVGKMIMLSFKRPIAVYEADRMKCINCCKCYQCCPVEKS